MIKNASTEALRPGIINFFCGYKKKQIETTNKNSKKTFEKRLSKP